MLRHLQLTLVSVSILAGCNALDKPGAHGSKTIVPTDTRATQAALRALPAISGGTLALSPDGQFAVVADPDRDRISFVTLASGEVRNIDLELGDEPGRAVVDGELHAHVALRGAGDLISVDVQTGGVLQRKHVCSAPRGIAFDSASAQLHVACADGRLVSLNASDGETVRDLPLGSDLRDVVVQGDQLLVSTFKGAKLIAVDAGGNVTNRTQPANFQLPLVQAVAPGQPINNPQVPEFRSMQAELAWRMVKSGSDANSVMMLHQGAATSQVDVKQSSGSDGGGDQGSAYGGAGASCSGIVTANVTQLDATGPGQTFALAGATLAVDMAISPLDGSVAIAEAGSADSAAPRPFVVFDSEGGATATSGASDPLPGVPSALGPGVGTGDGRILLLSSRPGASGVQSPMGDSAAPCEAPLPIAVPGQVTAVAFTPKGQLIAQSREPATLMIVSLSAPLGPASTPSSALLTPRTIDLGGASALDTGHELFHRDSGGGIACASCHGEGAEDGHTWIFSDVGARRTQALNVGLEGTAPFHWSGDLPNVGTLMERVFVARMGGVHQSSERIDALTHFLFAFKPPTAIVAADDPAAARGNELFHSKDVGCNDCHQGAKFTNNKSYDVGTTQGSEQLQVPSLRGVGYRAPFIHTGCAETLRARFDPSCGGARHGHTSQLDDGQIDDLIAYLRSI